MLTIDDINTINREEEGMLDHDDNRRQELSEQRDEDRAFEADDNNAPAVPYNEEWF